MPVAKDRDILEVTFRRLRSAKKRAGHQDRVYPRTLFAIRGVRFDADGAPDRGAQHGGQPQA